MANKKEVPLGPKNLKGWHTDDDWYRMFLDSTGCAITVIHCFADIPEHVGWTILCEGGIEGKHEPSVPGPAALDKRRTREIST